MGTSFITRDRDHENKDVAVFWMVCVIGAAIFIITTYSNRLFFHDDAYISLRYALNFAEFGDLSWNPGDTVEGYTNFLHLMLVSGLIRLGIDPVLAAQSLNAVFAAVLLFSVYLGARYLLPENKILQLLAVVAAASNVSLVVWVFGGLEAPMVAGLISCGIVAALPFFSQNPKEAHFRSAFLSGLFFAAAALTRPDSVVIIAAASLSVLAFAKPAFWQRFWCAAIVGGLPFFVLLGHMSWRVQYYGDYLPNTFYAKVGVDPALRFEKVGSYFTHAAARYLPVTTLAAIGFMIAIFSRKVTRPMVFLVNIVLAHCAYVLWSGGDHMAASRVLLQLAAPCSLLLVLALSKFSVSQQRIGILATLFGLCLSAYSARSFNIDWAAYNGSIVGKYINEEWPANSIVGLNTAGATPFYARQMNYIDMLGLNDREIAKRKDIPKLALRQRMPGHAKGDGAYVLSRKPDYIIFGGAEGIDVADAEKWFLTGVEVRDNPEFIQCYEGVEVILPIPPEMEKYRRKQDGITFRYYQRTCS